MIHGPSLGLGAAVASAAILISFAVSPQGEQVLVEVPAPDSRIALLDGGSEFLGDPGARVTLVEFGDYQCHFCNVFFHETEPLIVRDYVETGKVKMTFKDFTIIGQDSVAAAHAARCAGDQGMFWEYHDILYDNWDGENTGWASPPNLDALAREAGLDSPAFAQCMLDGRHLPAIEESNTDARALGLTGTPAFFVIGPDGQLVGIFGAQPYEAFARALDAELEKIA